MIKQFLLSVAAILLLTVGVTAQEKYAVLITGSYSPSPSGCWGKESPEKYEEEFWNDTFLMWEMLLRKGYSQENIIVLFDAGVDYPATEQGSHIALRYKPGIDTIVTDYAATRANVYSVFEGLATGSNGFPKIKEEDFLYIWTFDHGGWCNNGDTYLCLMNDEIIWDYEFADLVNQIGCQKKVVFMQQCGSGGFVDDLQNENTIIFTATSDHNVANCVILPNCD